MARRPKGFPFLILGASLVGAVWCEGYCACLDRPADTFTGTLHATPPAAHPLVGPAAILRRIEESRTGTRYARGAAARKESTWGPSRPTVFRAERLTVGPHTVDSPSLAAVSRFEPVAPTQALADQIAKAAPNHRVIIEKDAFVVESTLPQDPDAAFIPAFRLRFEQIPVAAYPVTGQLKNGVLFPATATASHWFLRILSAIGVFFGLHIRGKSRPR